MALEGVVPLAEGVDPTAVHPPREVGCGRHVGRYGDDVPGDLGVAGQRRQHVAKGLLGRRGRPGRALEPLGDADGRRGRVAPREPDPGRHDPTDVAGLDAAGREGAPLVSLGHPQLAAERLDLVGGELGAVVERITDERQPPALERPGQDRHRPVAGGVGLGEGVHDGVEVVAPDVREERARLGGAEIVQRRPRRRRRVAEQRRPRGVRGEAQERVVLEVHYRLETLPQPLAARPREARRAPAAVAEPDHAPSEGTEQPLELAAPPVADHAVEALPVQVDHDDVTAQVGHRLLGPGLPHAPLVQLRVPDQRDVAGAAGSAVAGGAEVVREVAIHQGREGGRDGAQAHRAGREVEPAGVLGAARIGLKAVEGPVRLQALGGQQPAQHLDRVEDRRRGRLDRDAVPGPQELEVEGGQQREDRRRARLVAADPLRRRVLPLGVGVVNGVRRQPEEAILDALQDPPLVGGQARGVGRAAEGRERLGHGPSWVVRRMRYLTA